AMALNCLGDVRRSMGEYDSARDTYEQSGRRFARISVGIAPYHGLFHNMGYVALGYGSIARAARLFLESGHEYQRVGTDRRGVAECVLGWRRLQLPRNSRRSVHSWSEPPRPPSRWW